MIYWNVRRPRFTPGIDTLLSYLQNLNIKLIDIEYPNYSFQNSTKIMLHKGVNFLYDTINHPVFITKVTLEIPILGDFPGVYTNFVIKSIGKEGILKLMENYTESIERKVIWSFGLSYRDSLKSLVILEKCEGEISIEPKGSDGFGWDDIFFIPQEGKTFAEDPLLKIKFGARYKVAQQFLNWYNLNYQS